jgi:predicted dehydrogenase
VYRCILFLGLGGAGQRHLRILREALPSTKMIGVRRTGKTPVLHPDFTVKNGATLESEYEITLFDNINEAYQQDPDLVVIATPTFNHAESIIQAAENGVNILVEKPGAINTNQARAVMSAVKKNKVGFFISYQRRFHPLVSQLKNILNSHKIGNLMSIRVAISSYVPDWHPYEDFHDLYACRSDLGGGVLKTETHEIDFISWLFGIPRQIFSTYGCRGKFNIDVEDSANLLLDYDSFSVQMSMCFMQKKQERNFKFFGQEGWVELDLITQKLVVCYYGNKNRKEYEYIVNDDELFELQADYFLNQFTPSDNRYLDALEMNSVIIEESLNNIN